MKSRKEKSQWVGVGKEVQQLGLGQLLRQREHGEATQQPHQQEQDHPAFYQAKSRAPKTVETAEYGETEGQIQQIAGKGPDQHDQEKEQEKQQVV